MKHKVKVWLSYKEARPGSPYEKRIPYKWRWACACGAGGMSWSWWREYDVLASGLTRKQWIEENGEPAGGALMMALEHVGLDGSIEGAITSIKEATT